MNLNDDIKERMSIWPRKLTSVMEIQRQRYSQLNKKFKQRPVLNLSQSSKIQPIILPQASRPQPRQQPRLRQQIHLPPTRRSTTAQIQHQKPPPSPLISEDQKYITLANLSKLLHVLQINDKIKDRSDTPTDNTSTSTSTSAKQRVQQHLQETATRWWRPIRSSDSHPLSSTVQTSGLSTVMQQYADENIQLERNIPLLVSQIFSFSTEVSFSSLDNRFKFYSSDEYTNKNCS